MRSEDCDIAYPKHKETKMDSFLGRRIFWYVNRFFMVPVFRLGLGSLLGNPLTGYIMVLKTIGRKTGIVRYTPTNYAVMNGNVYCLSGYGKLAHWYRNLRENPNLELIMPGRAIAGIAETVTDPDEALRAARRVLRHAGIAGFGMGFNPFTASDELIRAKMLGFPIVRIRPTGLASGPTDGGGWFWILAWLASLWLFWPRRKSQ